jgi:hypothetical protein
MRLCRCRPIPVLAACCFSASAVFAQDQAPRPPRGPSFWQAVAGVVVANGVPWAHNRFIADWPWASVGTRSWVDNLGRGFVWDDNSFHVNQFSHPYHGSFYHNSARASGYGFWGAVPFVAAGSATWELFGETITASLNDLISTTLGGIALGEVTYRLSTLLGSRRGAGRNGLGRELGSYVMSPIAQVQDLVRQRSQHPGELTGSQEISAGRRSGQSFLELAMHYGDPFDPEPAGAYDVFEFRLQLSPSTPEVVHHLGISGLLSRRTLSQTARGQMVFGVFQHYDFDDLPALRTSGHSVSTALLYRHTLDSRTQLNFRAHAEGLLLGAITAEYGNAWRRDYDLGPGAGARLGATLVRNGREWLRAEGRMFWLHSIHGSGGDHIATFVKMGATVPLLGPVGLGGDVSVTTRHSSFPDLPHVRRQVQNYRAYLTWSP